MAKGLGDLLIQNKTEGIELWKFFALAVAIIIFRTLSRLLFFYPARLQQRNLRIELVSRLENALPSKYKELNDGQIFQRLFDDLNRIRGFVGFALLQIGNIIIASLVFVPKINEFKPEFLIAFSPLVISVAIFSAIITFFQPFIKKSYEYMEQVQNFIIESYDAKKTIQNYHSESIFNNKLVNLCRSEMKFFYLHAVGKAFAFPMVKIGVGVSLIWAAFIVKRLGLPSSDLIYFTSFLFLVLEPLLYVSWIGVVISHGYVSWGRIKDLVRMLDKGLDSIPDELKEFKISFWDSSIKLDIKEKAWNVLVGDTGSGKSYCMEKVAEGLELRKTKYSLIHQEPYLYNDSLEKNIFLGKEPTSHEKTIAIKYLKDFGLDILTENEEDLLAIEIGENGKRISGGQGKRVALIRSLLADVDYILWDDPFSSVDLILEDQIIKALKGNKELEEKTFVFTSHRLSTVRNCDYVTYLAKDKGIIEEGDTYKIFENNNSLVKEFFEKQLA